MPSSLHPRGTEDPITSPYWDHCPFPCIFLRMLSSYSPYRNAQVASLHSIYIQILPYRQCFPWLCDFFFWHLSKFIQWQKTVVFQYPAFSAFRRTFSTFVFLTSSQRHDLVHLGSIYFFFQWLAWYNFLLHKVFCSGLSYSYKCNHQNDTSVIHRNTARWPGLPVSSDLFGLIFVPSLALLKPKSSTDNKLAKGEGFCSGRKAQRGCHCPSMRKVMDGHTPAN